MKTSDKKKKMVSSKIDSKKSYEELRKKSWEIWHELADNQPVKQSNILDLLIDENEKA